MDLESAGRADWGDDAMDIEDGIGLGAPSSPPPSPHEQQRIGFPDRPVYRENVSQRDMEEDRRYFRSDMDSWQELLAQRLATAPPDARPIEAVSASGEDSVDPLKRCRMCREDTAALNRAHANSMEAINPTLPRSHRILDCPWGLSVNGQSFDKIEHLPALLPWYPAIKKLADAASHPNPPWPVREFARFMTYHTAYRKLCERVPCVIPPAIAAIGCDYLNPFSIAAEIPCMLPPEMSAPVLHPYAPPADAGPRYADDIDAELEQHRWQLAGYPWEYGRRATITPELHLDYWSIFNVYYRDQVVTQLYAMQPQAARADAESGAYGSFNPLKYQLFIEISRKKMYGSLRLPVSPYSKSNREIFNKWLREMLPSFSDLGAQHLLQFALASEKPFDFDRLLMPAEVLEFYGKLQGDAALMVDPCLIFGEWNPVL